MTAYAVVNSKTCSCERAKIKPPYIQISAKSIVGQKTAKPLHVLSDIVFDQNFIAVFIESSKTDKFRDGSWIMIAKTGTQLCPVDNVKKYIEWAELNSEGFLFCNLSKIKQGYKIRSDRKVMS